MSRSIVVIDYGMGNLRSVCKALEHVADRGDKVRVTDDPGKIADADRVVFPGQGAARDCMAAISDHHLNQAVLEAAHNKPFLGICMGLQVLMESSDENGGTTLLGLFPGRVIRFPTGEQGSADRLKVPHMGWNTLTQESAHPLWAGIPDGTRFYFVHSYYVEPVNRALVVGTTEYGLSFASAIEHENLFATQFHPEKSAEAGLRLLHNFVTWSV